MTFISNLPEPKLLDTRLNAYTANLADQRLRGAVEAERFVTGSSAWVSAVFADLKSRPDDAAGLDSQLLHGERVLVFDLHEDWAWVQSTVDHYVGWTKSGNLSDDMHEPDHMVMVPRTFLYARADMKSPRTGYRAMGSRIAIVAFEETRGTRYGLLRSGEAIIADHIAGLDQYEADPVSVAEKLLRTPYLWGGTTAFGIDCSGLVQLCMRMAGNSVLRDSDMQAASIGNVVETVEDWNTLERGDLVFWRGHVGLCQGKENGKAMLIHANGNTMDVTSEPLEAAIKRTAYLYEMPIGVRRP